MEGGGRQQEVNMSMKKRTGRKQGTGRSLRPHNVCFLSVPSARLRLKKDSIVRTSSEGFLSGDAEGQIVARPCCGAPKQQKLIEVTLLTSVSCSPPSPIVGPSSSHAGQNSDWFSQLSAHIPNCAFIHRPSVRKCFFPFPSLVTLDLCLPSPLISPHL